MNIYDLNFESHSGNEALTVGEKLGLFFKEFSLSVDSLNAKLFNSSVHQINDIKTWKKVKASKDYFAVAIKHIPSPVFFNSNKISFVEYVDFVLSSIPILKLVDEQASSVYKALKTCAATGQLPFSIRNVQDIVLINESKSFFSENIDTSEIYTRAINELYPNFTVAFDTLTLFNKEVSTIKSRDVEVCAKKVENVVTIIKILKKKIDTSDVILSPKESDLLNESIKELVDNVSFAGKMIALLSDLNRVLVLQTKEIQKV